MRSEQENQQLIDREYEQSLSKIDGFVYIESLRDYAKWLAKEHRDMREHLADYQYGHLKPHADE